jgi:DNA modification methylase
MGSHIVRNRLNDLTGKNWLLFQKSWFVLNPKPRTPDVVLHPAKFPEELVEEFIGFFTKKGEIVLDPMAGTGSALVAALGIGRKAIGIELQPKYAKIAEERCYIASGEKKSHYKLYCADARNIKSLKIPNIDYCITSPPYWDMLLEKGFETQKFRRKSGLDVHYSEDDRDAGNIRDYDTFLNVLEEIYSEVHCKLRQKAYLTIIVKNIKKKGKIYPLAWDLARRLSAKYSLKDEKIWCQDNQKLAPYGYGNAWVSNTMHHYCLNFRKD